MLKDRLQCLSSYICQFSVAALNMRWIDLPWKIGSQRIILPGTQAVRLLNKCKLLVIVKMVKCVDIWKNLASNLK